MHPRTHPEGVPSHSSLLGTPDPGPGCGHIRNPKSQIRNPHGRPTRCSVFKDHRPRRPCPLLPRTNPILPCPAPLCQSPFSGASFAALTLSRAIEDLASGPREKRGGLAGVFPTRRGGSTLVYYSSLEAARHEDFPGSLPAFAAAARLHPRDLYIIPASRLIVKRTFPAPRRMRPGSILATGHILPEPTPPVNTQTAVWHPGTKTPRSGAFNETDGARRHP
jgi:hypothetical protein